MLKKILLKFEDPKIPILGPNVKALKFWGLLLPEGAYLRKFYLLMHVCVTVFVITEYVDIWFVRYDINMLLTNLKVSMLASVSVVKVSSFLVWQHHWKDIIDYVTKADLNQRKTKDLEHLKIINDATNYCRKVSYSYWILMYTTVLVVMIQPLINYFSSPTYRENVRNGTEVYLQVVSSWVPFNKNTIPGYLAASAYQTYAAIYGGGWITSFDTSAIVIMVFFKIEIQLLRKDAVKIYDDSEEVDKIKTMVRLQECHRRHVELIKYTDLFDRCLSPIMLFYMFVCSVMLCASAYQITIETRPMQRFLTTEYLVFGIAQLFVYCWHSNDVFYQSQILSRGPYDSLWYLTSARQKRNVHILMQQFNKRILFSAGPFSKLTLSTFINILKGAYSYYTLISKSQANSSN